MSVIFVSVTSPVFFISISYWSISSSPLKVSPLSIIVTDFVTSADGDWVNESSVGVSPPLDSSPSLSLTSEIISPTSFSIETVKELETPPESKAAWEIV